jgi:ribosomal protein S18 acetylase RimI-like enzyme
MMEVRCAVHNDIAQICLLYNEFFAYNAEKDPVYCRAGKESGEYPKSVIDSDSSDLIVAVDNDDVIGFIHIKEGRTPPYDALVQNHYAQIIDFIVTAEHRKKGIGTKLMDAAKEWANKRNLDYIELFVLQGAKDEHRFYEHNEFVTVMQTMRYMM